MTPADIAKVCHEANRALCEALGDTSQPKWEDAPQWQKDSALHGVDHHLRLPGSGANHAHIAWCEEKEAAGWVYGPVKDPEKKTHPCLVPFEDLPPEQQAKDYLFKAVVGALARTLP